MTNDTRLAHVTTALRRLASAEEFLGLAQDAETNPACNDFIADVTRELSDIYARLESYRQHELGATTEPEDHPGQTHIAFNNAKGGA